LFFISQKKKYAIFVKKALGIQSFICEKHYYAEYREYPKDYAAK